MSEDAGSQSLFVVLRYKDRNPYLCSIVQLDDDDDIHIHGQSDPDPEKETPPGGVRVLDVKWVAHFKVEVPPRSPPLDTWVFSPPSATSAAGDLYILPDWSFNDHGKCVVDQPLYGAKFNCSTKSFQQPIKPPNIFKFGGIALTVGLDVYFMMHPAFSEEPPFHLGKYSVFERYNPADQSWEELGPFPKALAIGPHSFIVASAVWDDHTILLNVNHCQIWAYNVFKRKWYHVHVQDDKEAEACGYRSKKYQQNRCYAIKGEAFVVQNTIYALSDAFDSVLALSIEKNHVGCGKLEYSCKIHWECFVPSVTLYSLGIWSSGNGSLALLGEDKLCVVRSLDYQPDDVDYQPIHVTYIKLMREEGKMDVTNHCFYRFEVPEEVQFAVPEDVEFHIQLCFSQPKCKTTTVGSELCSTFILNPRGLAKPGDSDEDDPLLFTRVNNSSQIKVTEQQVAASYLKKRKMSEIKDLHLETILNMLQEVNQKLDCMTQPFMLLCQLSQTLFTPSAPSSSLESPPLKLLRQLSQKPFDQTPPFVLSSSLDSPPLKLLRQLSQKLFDQTPPSAHSSSLDLDDQITTTCYEPLMLLCQLSQTLFTPCAPSSSLDSPPLKLLRQLSQNPFDQNPPSARSSSLDLDDQITTIGYDSLLGQKLVKD